MAERWNWSVGQEGGGGTHHDVLASYPLLLSLNSTELNDWIDILVKDFKDNLHTHRQPLTIVLICAYVPVMLLALVGNTLVLLVVLGNKAMRNVTNYFLLNLALSDLIVTVVCLPLTVGDLVYKFWIFGEFLCRIAGYLQGVSVSASVLTITALSVERYLAIRHPVSSRRLFTTLRAKVTLVLIWCTAAGIMLPLFLVRTLDYYALSDGVTVVFCHERWLDMGNVRIGYDSFIFVAIYIIPGAVVIFSYSSIGCRLLTHDESLRRQCSYSKGRPSRMAQDRIMAGRRRVARMLMVLAVLFAVSWLPYHTVSLYLNFVNENNLEARISLATLSVSLLLGHSHSAQNPIIYCLMSDSFKRGMTAILKCRRTNMAETRQSEANHWTFDSKGQMDRRRSLSIRRNQQPAIQTPGAPTNPLLTSVDPGRGRGEAAARQAQSSSALRSSDLAKSAILRCNVKDTPL